MTINSAESISSSLKGTLHICVTFHFNANRLEYLRDSISNAGELADVVNLTIVTNVSDSNSVRLIEGVMPRHLNSTNIVSPELLGHPFFLTWIHFEIFRTIIQSGQPGDFFLYKEDDITFTPDNVQYWHEGVKDLEGTVFYPSFVRYEQGSPQADQFLTDITKRSWLWKLPKIKKSSKKCYVNFEENYQGIYLLDRESMEFHLNSKSSHPDNGDWGIREKATRGLSLHAVPKKFFSRNLVCVNPKTKRIDPRALIRHLPNNYLLEPRSPHAKVPVEKCFY
jgi:hypothetical protein